MGELQEFTGELEGWEASIEKRNDQEYNVSFLEQQSAGLISFRNTSHILLEYGEHDLYVGGA